MPTHHVPSPSTACEDESADDAIKITAETHNVAVRRPPTPPLRPTRNPDLVGDRAVPASLMPKPPICQRLLSHRLTTLPLPTSSIAASSADRDRSTTTPALASSTTSTSRMPSTPIAFGEDPSTGEGAATRMHGAMPGLRLEKVVVCSRGTKCQRRTFHPGGTGKQILRLGHRCKEFTPYLG